MSERGTHSGQPPRRVALRSKNSETMTHKARLTLIFLIAVLTFGGYAHGFKVSEKDDLSNFFKLNENVYRGAQPTDAGIKLLKEKHGIKTIVYLRGKGDGANHERKLAAAEGIKFVNVPLHNWFRPKNSQIENAISEITKEENQPVFVHCARGADRTGTVIAVYRMKFDGFTGKEASKEAKKFGIGWWQIWMKDYIHDYYRDFILKK